MLRIWHLVIVCYMYIHVYMSKYSMHLSVFVMLFSACMIVRHLQFTTIYYISSFKTCQCFYALGGVLAGRVGWLLWAPPSCWLTKIPIHFTCNFLVSNGWVVPVVAGPFGWLEHFWECKQTFQPLSIVSCFVIIK